ncbi:MAG TPA: 50S ribosomal protein L15 [Candidatus Binataceae bacterium]|nr:50S ribosomal protein L15 [Candidatus Binataceae bacterium]
MRLGELKPAAGSTTPERRIGRGIGSGMGKTSGRGHKGRGSRSGGNTPPGYEGGQMPLRRRVPKRGFRRLQKNAARREEFALVNLRQLAEFPEGATVDAAALAERGFIPAGRKLKILGDGEIKTKLTVRADAFSAAAREKIGAAGGAAEIVTA